MNLFIDRILKSFGLIASVSFLLLGCGGGSGSETGNSNTITNFNVGTNAGTGGSISPANRIVPSGQSTTFTVTPNDGYMIGNVTGCNGSLNGNTYTTGTISSACNVNANFDLKNYPVIANAGFGGSIDPVSASVAHGSKVTFTVTPLPGFGIANVTGCNGGLDNNTYTSGIITSPCNVSATFTITLAAPQSLDVTVKDSELVFNWEIVTTASSYNLYYDIEPNIDPANYSKNGTGTLLKNVTTPFELKELTNDIPYYAVVTAVLGSAESLPSNEASGIPVAKFNAIGGLNDTGMSLCSDNGTTLKNCPVTDFGEQDGDIGRDAQARLGTLTKIGNGSNGFDYTKLGFDGSPLEIQNAEWNPNLTEASGSVWSCVRDNVTGLIWEVKSDDGRLNDKNHTYSWFNNNSTNNGGQEGEANLGTCSGSDCDTSSFVDTVNKSNFCGANDWRMPTKMELLSIFHNGRSSPTIDVNYFPNTRIGTYWTSTPSAQENLKALSIKFISNNGSVIAEDKTIGNHVRLVRSSN